MEAEPRSQRVEASAPIGGTSSLAGEVLISVFELTNLFNSAIASAGADVIKSNAEVIVMITLRLDGAQRPRDLLEPTGLTSGGLANLIDRLTAAGLVQRRRGDVHDGRAVHIELTADGNAMLGRFVRAVGPVFRLASPLLRRWRELFTELDIAVGPVPTSGVETRRHLVQLRQLATAGRRGHIRLSELFGPDDPAPHRSTHVLWLASKPDGARPRTISHVLGLSSATTSDLLDRLEQRELIVRLSDAEDGRGVIIRSTDAGRALLDKAIAAQTPLLPELAVAFLPVDR